MPVPLAIQIGPLVLAADRALAVVLIAAFLITAELLAGKVDRAADRASLLALGVGILTARFGYIGSNWNAFAAEPFSMLAIWQGGFSLLAGVVGAIATIVFTTRSRRTALALSVAVLLLSGTYYIGSSLLRPDPRPLPANIALQGWSGETITLSQLHGRPFVVNLWASWCLPCRREMPMLVDVASLSSIPILLVNSGEERSAADQFLRTNNLPTGSVYLDRPAKLAAAAGVVGYPATMFVNADGEIEKVHLGELSRAALTDGLRSLDRRSSQKQARRDQVGSP